MYVLGKGQISAIDALLALWHSYGKCSRVCDVRCAMCSKAMVVVPLDESIGVRQLVPVSVARGFVVATRSKGAQEHNRLGIKDGE